jgi:hypothetical protein
VAAPVERIRGFPDLAANSWTNSGEIAGNGIDDDANGYIDDVHGYDFYNSDAEPEDVFGHGTHVAGTMGATGNDGGGICGAASESRVSDGGGSSLNTACALARAGHRVLAVGRVGDDPAGHACLEALHRHGVETECQGLPGRTTKRNTCFVERESRETAFAVEVPERAVPPWEDRPAARRGKP